MLLGKWRGSTLGPVLPLPVVLSIVCTDRTVSTVHYTSTEWMHPKDPQLHPDVPHVPAPAAQGNHWKTNHPPFVDKLISLLCLWLQPFYILFLISIQKYYTSGPLCTSFIVLCTVPAAGSSELPPPLWFNCIFLYHMLHVSFCMQFCISVSPPELPVWSKDGKVQKMSAVWPTG